MQHFWSVLFVLACAVLAITQPPYWGQPPYDYPPTEYYNQYGEYEGDDIDQAQEETEEHHEHQHRVHEKSQENYFDVRERDHEATEKDQETLEKSHEEDRAGPGTRKSGVLTKGSPKISEKDAKSFLKRRRKTM